VVSLHIAGMFAPSPLSGWLADRFGALAVVLGAGSMLVIACAVAAGGAGSSTVLVIAMVLLGVGWNLALVGGSLLLTSGVPVLDRPRREAWGEVGMGAAAAGGGAASGIVMAASGYPAVAAAGAAVAALLLPWAGLGRRRGAPHSSVEADRAA
jgi:MFS family permease